jgi:hypothetical protein
MKVPILILVVGVAATAALVSSACEFANTPRYAQANAGQNVTVADTTNAYDDFFGPETDVEVIGGDNSSVLGSVPPGNEASTPDPRRNDTAEPGEAGKHSVPDLANVPDCTGGICTIYRIGPVAGDTSDHLHVIASVPTSGGSRSFDLMGTKDNLVASRTAAAFNAGADDFNVDSFGGAESGDSLGSPDNFAYWQMQ